MMPLGPVSTQIPSTTTVRPKIGFSIDSIVGEAKKKGSNETEKSDDILNSQSPAFHHFHSHFKRSRSSSPDSQKNGLRGSPSSSQCSSISPRKSPEHQEPTSITNGPPPPGLHSSQFMNNHQFPPYPMLNFAAAAAAASHHQQAQLPPWMQGHHQQHVHPNHHAAAAAAAAAAHPLYPWLLAKQSRLFPHRFGPGPELPGFLLQPFRKPKRIRTAFSPNQLLKLEHAFERNHYVVGAERKQLANALSLTETQVKVWFQNRRTKHKRMQQEEESGCKSGTGLNSNPPDSTNSRRGEYDGSMGCSEEDEEILMDEDEDEEDVCLSDEEAEERERVREFREIQQRATLNGAPFL